MMNPRILAGWAQSPTPFILPITVTISTSSCSYNTGYELQSERETDHYCSDHQYCSDRQLHCVPAWLTNSQFTGKNLIQTEVGYLRGDIDECKLSRVIQNKRHYRMIFLDSVTTTVNI